MPPAPAARSRRPAGPPPDEAALREAALSHLARFAATEAGLVRVLDRRIARWARAAEAEGRERDDIAAAVAAARAAARAIAARLVQAGAVDDAAFAAARASRLARAGRSARAIAAHLAAKGVAPEVAAAALPEGEEAELLAALRLLRRKRLGPFAATPPDAEARRRTLGLLARAGFEAAVARRAVAMPAPPRPALSPRLIHRCRQPLKSDFFSWTCWPGLRPGANSAHRLSHRVFHRRPREQAERFHLHRRLRLP
jgi:regulatory protein